MARGAGDNTTYYYHYTGGTKPAPQNKIAPSPINWHAAPGRPVPNMHSTGPHGRPPLVPPPPPPVPAGLDKNAFSYEELAAATSDFSEENLLGQGGFGYVYRGVLPDGKEVAVKQLSSGSGQGEREFQAEVDMISRVHHRHLVPLVGYCIAGAHRLLVYDFVPNNTLEHHLHGKGSPVMKWTTRLRIAVGSAKGLAYLHEECNPRIIHRDIKSANILLDNSFEALVADFGMVKLTSENDTHVSTRVMGTFGYLAPEYASSGKLTDKSDVFSYGVMLLELLTGRRPADRSSYGADCLVDWARQALPRAMADGGFDALVDPRLRGDYDRPDAARVAACAAACVRHAGRRRPKMSQIVKVLEGDVSPEELSDGVRPGQSAISSGDSSSGSEYGSGSYTAQMERIRKASALPSPDYSAEYPGSIPEFGYPSPASSAGGHVPSSERVNQRHQGHR
ncbi:proline-rich receptor-like protein kinase PERK1 [Oryza brachyantha]|uniref:proline-rich receptor-like protein kinase PERK1 n=1 Tax=Oryza brachyantha TaxID=4533 RepID=UPI001ADB285D|nr:proline-rich receptor-like protein kinase PERK1 [Oryza brachyantha]